ncbi:histidine triad domain protein [Gregarina niphandrodes]|uniref:Histidine triad domain protein n=1 Tax=Gregarina niphandrodes TaxID=110365 RepID=A0A023AYG3_GRENI|nr:histidine triad domain protein [Gregarina niphandrodes]EZG43325.1 histidine triad domain protein [Gregarina niphandrodes]|eukprot:XP_011133423.1 histidine triad domain protein [Gregarina niphandrodes]
MLQERCQELSSPALDGFSYHKVESSNNKEKKFLVDGVEMPYVLWASNHSFAIACPKPLAEGHVLVFPKRQVAYSIDLPQDEFYDLHRLAYAVGGELKKLYDGDATGLYANDGREGPDAGKHTYYNVWSAKESEKDVSCERYDKVESSILIDAQHMDWEEYSKHAKLILDRRESQKNPEEKNPEKKK